MSSITNSNYLTLLLNLKQVCREARVSIPNENQITEITENSRFIQFIDHLPNCSLDLVSKKVSEMVPDKLLVYEAARRTGMDDLAKIQLAKWQKKLDKQVQLYCQEEHKQAAHSSFHWEQKIQLVIEQTVLPIFRDPRQAEHQLYSGLTHVLSKEIVFRMLHSKQNLTFLPNHVFDLLGRRSPDSPEQYLIDQYAPYMEILSFKEDEKRMINDSLVILYFKRFPKLRWIDLSDCIKITPNCLRSGHPCLEKINLSGTAISKDQIPRKLFPNLVSIIQDDLKSILNLDKIIDHCELDSLPQQFISAELVLCSHESLEKLIGKFKNRPTVPGINHMLQIVNEMHKSEGFFVWENHFFKRIVLTFIDIWKNTWDSDIALASHCIEVLIQIWSNAQEKDESILQLISDHFVQDLSLTPMHQKKGSSNDKEIKTLDIMPLSSADIHRIRHLVKSIRGMNWISLEYVAQQICKNIENLNESLFYKKASLSQGPGKRDSDVIAKEFLNVNFMELSYLISGISTGPFGKMQDPHKTVRHSNPHIARSNAFLNLLFYPMTTTHHPGPFYHQPIGQSLACAFVLKSANTKDRAIFLKSILHNFWDYKSNNKYYSLSKLVLGAIEMHDIPDWDLDSPLTERLLSYRGVFHEKIDDEVKDQFWRALSLGRLGGHNSSLIEGLSLFYQRAETTAVFRNKVIDLLKSMGGILSIGPITGHLYYNPLTDDPIKAFARKTLNNLMSDIPKVN